MKHNFDYNLVRAALEESWSENTSNIFDLENPSYSQCAQTAIIVQEMFGGEILRTDGWPGYRHFYNYIGGVRYDFTADQFEDPRDRYEIKYRDWPSSAEEAQTETSPQYISELRNAFTLAYEKRVTA